MNLTSLAQLIIFLQFNNLVNYFFSGHQIMVLAESKSATSTTISFENVRLGLLLWWGRTDITTWLTHQKSSLISTWENMNDYPCKIHLMSGRYKMPIEGPLKKRERSFFSKVHNFYRTSHIVYGWASHGCKVLFTSHRLNDWTSISNQKPTHHLVRNPETKWNNYTKENN